MALFPENFNQILRTQRTPQGFGIEIAIGIEPYLSISIAIPISIWMIQCKAATVYPSCC